MRKTDDPAAHFRALIDALPDGVVVHRHGEVLFANPAALQLLGFDAPEQLVGRSVFDIVHPEEHDAVRERLERVLREDRPLDMREERLVRSDGEELVALVRALPIAWEGEPAVLAFAQDITDLRRYEERLAVADRLASVGTLAAGMAHDLNNPLAHLFLSLDLAEEVLGASGPLDAARADDVRRRVGGALHAADRLRAIVEDLRQFARHPEEEEEPISLASPLRRALALAGNHLRHRSRVQVDITDTGLVRASEPRLVQVFLNVLTNAVQALSPERPPRDNRIRVSCGPTAGGHAEVVIEDNGVGIPEAQLARVFEPYFTTKPSGEGTGLGLWMVQGVVERLGGEIDVTSDVGEGTRVTIRLPTLAATAPQTRPDPEDLDTTRLRVLVVDDEPEVANGIGDVLGSRHEVRVVTSGREAVQAILSASPPWDVVLCDVMMPDLGGREIYEQVAALQPALVQGIVFLTGGAFSPQAQAFLDRAGAQVLSKPIHARELRALMASAADRAGSRPVRGR